MHCFIFRTALPHTFLIRLPVSEYRGSDESGIPVRAGQMPGVVKNGANGSYPSTIRPPRRKDVRQVRRKQRNQNPLSIFQTNARAPCILVAASYSRKASISGAPFSSSTMARIEAFIEGHACVP